MAMMAYLHIFCGVGGGRGGAGGGLCQSFNFYASKFRKPALLPSSGNENTHSGGALEVRERLLSFGELSFVLQFGVQKCKD
jgi:hypothetical protein